MKDYPIGQVVPWVTETGEKLVVEEAKEVRGNKYVCTGCYFSDHQREKRGLAKFSCYVHQMACTPANRKDKKIIIFKPIP